jgi:apolipoprotein N-acyltransferase
MLRVILLSAPWRAVTATLVVVTWLTLPTYLLALFLLPPVPPIVMIRSFVLGTALPAAMAWGVVRLFAGTAEVRDATLRLRRNDLEIDVPCASIATVRPWRLPLPRAGLTIRTSSRALPVGIAVEDPSALVDRLAAGGVAVGAAADDPTVVWAATRRRRRSWSAVLKFPVFGTAPACILFYTHQHIAYGGTFGQYYLEGALPYLTTLGEYWATTIILLVSYASFWRAAGEIIVWTAALAGRAAAAGARRAVEIACGLAYYGGVPALLALRYLA